MDERHMLPQAYKRITRGWTSSHARLGATLNDPPHHRRRELAREPALKSDGGFTLIELLIAIVILSFGVLGVATLIVQAASQTGDTKAREGATNLAREVVEETLSLPYSALTPDQLTGALQAKPALAPAGGYSGWTVLRRQIPYTLSVSECYVDDPLDGRGVHDTNFCAGSAGSADTQPVDYKRISVTVSWTRRNIQRSTTQTTLVAPKGSKEAPAIRSITSSSGLVVTDSSATTVNFSATTSSSAAGVLWKLNDNTKGLASGSGTNWSFTWNISGLADGTYVIGAQAYNSAGSFGTPMSITITLNRAPPSAPQGFVAGYNSNTTKVDSEWLASPELDTVGYTVYRQQTGPSLGSVQQVNCGTVANPLYIIPQTECTDASPITASSGGAGTVTFRGNTSNQVSSNSTIPLALPAGASVNDVLVATVVLNANPGITAPSGWTLIKSTANGSGLQEVSFYHVVGSGEPSSYSFRTSNNSNRNLIGGISAYSNVDTSAPIDVSGATTGANNNAVSPNLTVAFGGSRVINAVAFKSVANGTTVTPDTGFTERHDRVLSALLGEYADANQSQPGQTGAKVATPSSGNGGWISQLIVLKPSGGGSTGLAVNYWVVAVDRDSAGAYRQGPASNVVNAYAPNVPPYPIAGGFTCTNNADGSNTLSWTQPTQPGDPDTGDYIAFDRIYRDGVRFDRTGLGTDNTFTDPSPSGTYDYYVTTVDTHLGEAPPTGSLTC
jgi:prepilin-type N-terminal cleavage/methylation domain-containing protein